MEEIPVAVVIPAYNRAELLPRAIASVARQERYHPREVIVVDDASDDDTERVARRLGAQVLRHRSNLGPAAARNTGFAATDTPWLMQLDSDDEWLPHCLAALWELRSGHVLVSGASIGLRGTGRPWYNGAPGTKPWVLRSPGELAFPDNFVASSAVLMRASCVRAAGCYRSDLRYAEDLELWLRMLELGTGVATPVVVSRYHGHVDQATAAPQPIHSGHARVLALSEDRSWWRYWLPVRWSAIPEWDSLRRSLADGEHLKAMRHVLRLLGHPQRLVGLMLVLRYRLQGRRRSSRFRPDGLPSVALLPGTAATPMRGDIDLRRSSFVAALLRLASHPTERAIVGRRRHVPLLGLLGIRAEAK